MPGMKHAFRSAYLLHAALPMGEQVLQRMLGMRLSGSLLFIPDHINFSPLLLLCSFGFASLDLHAVNTGVKGSWGPSFMPSLYLHDDTSVHRGAAIEPVAHASHTPAGTMLLAPQGYPQKPRMGHWRRSRGTLQPDYDSVPCSSSSCSSLKAPVGTHYRPQAWQTDWTLPYFS